MLPYFAIILIFNIGKVLDLKFIKAIKKKFFLSNVLIVILNNKYLKIKYILLISLIFELNRYQKVIYYYL